MTSPSKVDVWISRLVPIASACLVALACFFVWRVSMLVYRVEQSVVAVSADVRQVTGTMARVASLVDRLTERIERLERKTEEAIGMDELEMALDEIKDVRESLSTAEEPFGPEVEKEIKYLLGHICWSGRQFEISGKYRSAFRSYLYLLAKYKVYRRTLKSAEDFIEKVATKSIIGHPYYVLLEDGKKMALGAFLKEALEKHRAGGEKPPPPGLPSKETDTQPAPPREDED